MLCSEDLLKLELFQKLSSDRLEWICDRALEIRLARGDILVKEGDPHRGFFILTSGSVSITRFSEGMEMPIGQHHTSSFFGEMQVMADDLMPVSLKALTDCEIYELKSEDFLQLVSQCRDFGIMICRTVQRRVMGLQSFILNREKMAALGTLSAGLAHELNNPATAVVRSLQDIMPAMLELQRMNLVYGQRNVEDEHTQQWFNWTNLIDNSIDAMTESGELEIVTVNKSDRIMVNIIDSGEGIPPEIQSRVFELFFTTKAIGKSSGIGLDNVRRIVENRHRGSISLESKPGRTCFSIYLPVDLDGT